MLTPYQTAYCLPSGYVVNVLKDGNLHIYNKDKLNESFFGTLKSFAEAKPELFVEYEALHEALRNVTLSNGMMKIKDTSERRKEAELQVVIEDHIIACKDVRDVNVLYVGQCVDHIIKSSYRDLSALKSTVQLCAHP